jgi:hypothetical protein
VPTAKDTNQEDPCPHLDIAASIEPIQLVDNLKHGTLHLIVTTSTIIEARTTCRQRQSAHESAHNSGDVSQPSWQLQRRIKDTYI